MEVLNTINEKRYQQAKRQVKELKGFYVHLTVYICVNLFIIGVQALDLGKEEVFWSWGLLKLPAIWGVGLGIHFLSVFLPRIIFGDNWEERKINQIMQKNNHSK